MPKKQRMSVIPTMQSDGSLKIEVQTDAYASLVEFFQDGGPQAASQAVAHGIKAGLYKDVRLIEWYRTLGKVARKDIDFMVKRFDGTPLKSDGILDLSTDAITITPGGVRH